MTIFAGSTIKQGNHATIVGKSGRCREFVGVDQEKLEVVFISKIMFAYCFRYEVTYEARFPCAVNADQSARLPGQQGLHHISNVFLAKVQRATAIISHHMSFLPGI